MSFGMKRISVVASTIMGEFGPTFCLNVALRKDWSEIVGEQLREVTSLCDVRYVGADTLLITINILSSAIIFAKCGSESMIEKIRCLTGVSNIRLKFRHSSVIQSEDIQRKIEFSGGYSEISEINDQFKSKVLKRALESLKAEMQDAA
jgi:hypothetical protein